MKRIVYYALILVLAIVLELTVFSFYPISGTSPDLLLVIILVSSLLAGSKTAVILAFFAGTFQDIYMGGLLGVYTIVKMIIAGMTTFFEGFFFKENFLLAPGVIFLLTIIHELLVVLLTEELIFSINYWYSLKNVIFPEALYNSVLGLALYVIFSKLKHAGDMYHG